MVCLPVCPFAQRALIANAHPWDGSPCARPIAQASYRACSQGAQEPARDGTSSPAPTLPRPALHTAWAGLGKTRTHQLSHPLRPFLNAFINIDWKLQEEISVSSSRWRPGWSAPKIPVKLRGEGERRGEITLFIEPCWWHARFSSNSTHDFQTVTVAAPAHTALWRPLPKF